MRRVALIGKSSTSRDAAPFGRENWELWAMAHDYFPGITRAVEMHRRSVWQPDGSHGVGDLPFVDWLKIMPCPIYMREIHEDIPNSVQYPLEEVRALITENMRGPKQEAFKFESTISYLLGLALLELEPGDHLGLWGIDLAIDSEYWYQLPNAVLIIGMLLQKGITIFIPPHSALLEPYAEVDYGMLEGEDPNHRRLQDPMITRKAG